MAQVKIPNADIGREDLVEAYMGIFGVSRFDAEAMVAVERGESKGSCVAVDKDGREWSLRELEARGELKKAG